MRDSRAHTYTGGEVKTRPTRENTQKINTPTKREPSGFYYIFSSLAPLLGPLGLAPRVFEAIFRLLRCRVLREPRRTLSSREVPLR